MGKNEGLLIRKLVLVGHRKNYTVPFHPGVNIIYGDADTGKSSILRILHYMLGGKKIHLDKEISASVKHAILDLEIDNSPYCIQRDLFDSNRLVEIYECSYEDISEHFPTKYTPTFAKSGSETKSLSEFLFDRLNLPSVEIKQAPTKEDSGFSRLSILDLFKYCYMDQDEVGNRSILNQGNFVLEVKNREVFKYIFNVLDTHILSLEAEISEKSGERKDLENRLQVISSFLSDTEFSSIEDIHDDIENLSKQNESLDLRIKELDNQVVQNSAVYSELKSTLGSIYSEIDVLELKRSQAIDNIERFTRLHNDYLNDIKKLKATQSANNLIGKELIKETACPICENSITLSELSDHFSITDDDKVNHEINSVTRRAKDLLSLLNDSRKKIDDYDALLSSLYEAREKARRYIDEQMSEAVTPYLTQRDALIHERASLSERRKARRHELRVRNQEIGIADAIGRLAGNIEILKTRLETLRKDMPSIDGVLTDLSGFLDRYLRVINIKNRFGVSISPKSYLPVVRDIEYKNINSGGLRTIISLGYLSILQEYRLKHDINLPNLLMIDTVGKFLGKTKDVYEDGTDRNEDDAEGISDPEKYQNIYEYLINLSSDYEDKGRNLQIILVDNDVPAAIATEYKGFVIAHYSSQGKNNLPIGLIDDWDAFQNR